MERTLLWLPWLGGLIFGLGPLLVPSVVASLTGYVNDDEYIGRLAGAATLGYAVALWPALRGQWSRGGQSIIVAVLVFNLTSLLACAVEIVAGRTRPVVLLILVTSVLIVAITAWLLARRRLGWPDPPDIPTWVTGVLIVATLAAAFFGVFPQFPAPFALLFGYHGTDVFLYRQFGAATVGYAAMGLTELRSRRWEDIRLPGIMGTAYNGVAFVASVWELTQGRATLLVLVVALASFVFTIAFAIVIREGDRVREARLRGTPSVATSGG